MNIIERIGKVPTKYIFTFYGAEDFQTNKDVGIILENASTIQEYYTDKDSRIDNIDDFYDYLFLYKYSKFSDIEYCIADDKREEFSKIIQFVKTVLDKYKNGDIVRFLKENYKDIYSGKIFRAYSALFDIVFRFNSGCKEILEYLIENSFNRILRDFDKLQNIIVNDKQLTQHILDTKNISQVKNNTLKNYLDVIKVYYNKNPQLVADNIEEIARYGKELSGTINADNYVVFESEYRHILSFFRDIRHGYANWFEENMSKIKSAKTDYLDKYGSAFEQKIDLKKEYPAFYSNKASMFYRILCLTHIRKNKVLINRLQDLGEIDNSDVILRLVDSDIPYNEYFDVIKQGLITLHCGVSEYVMNGVLNNDNLSSFFGHLSGILIGICEMLGAEHEKDDLAHDMQIAFGITKNYIETYQSLDEYQKQGLNYGITMFFFGLTEKVLRLYYKYKNRNDYLKDKEMTLGKLLSESNDIMVEMLGIDHMKILIYLLLTVPNTEIGLNLRNKYAHYSDISGEKITWERSKLSIYLFVDIINQMYIVLDKVKRQKD